MPRSRFHFVYARTYAHVHTHVESHVHTHAHAHINKHGVVAELPQVPMHVSMQIRLDYTYIGVSIK